jgi:hypothetical protein
MESYVNSVPLCLARLYCPIQNGSWAMVYKPLLHFEMWLSKQDALSYHVCIELSVASWERFQERVAFLHKVNSSTGARKPMNSMSQINDSDSAQLWWQPIQLTFSNSLKTNNNLSILKHSMLSSDWSMKYACLLFVLTAPTFFIDGAHVIKPIGSPPRNQWLQENHSNWWEFGLANLILYEVALYHLGTRHGTKMLISLMSLRPFIGPTTRILGVGQRNGIRQPHIWNLLPRKVKKEVNLLHRRNDLNHADCSVSIQYNSEIRVVRLSTLSLDWTLEMPGP